MVRIQIRLTEQQSREIMRMAAERHTSVAALIRRATDDFLSGSSMPASADRRQRALAVAGCFRSGKNDYSTKHDDYLAEAYGE